jgi:hypothetical protein
LTTPAFDTLLTGTKITASAHPYRQTVTRPNCHKLLKLSSLFHRLDDQSEIRSGVCTKVIPLKKSTYQDINRLRLLLASASLSQRDLSGNWQIQLPEHVVLSAVEGKPKGAAGKTFTAAYGLRQGFSFQGIA